jgi:transcription elongation GreA/GreB family factor
MNIKQKIVNELRTRFITELEKIEAAASTAKDLATDSELKAEDRFDTRATEAGYLAGAQQRRVEELKGELELIDHIDLSLSNKKMVSIGSLVTLKTSDITKDYFLAPTSGGVLLNIDQRVILVVSTFSPIGKEVISLSKGDRFTVELPSGNREYEIVEIE